MIQIAIKVKFILKAIKEVYNKEKAINYFIIEAHKIKEVSSHQIKTNIISINTNILRPKSRKKLLKIRSRIHNIQLETLELFPDISFDFKINVFK